MTKLPQELPITVPAGNVRPACHKTKYFYSMMTLRQRSRQNIVTAYEMTP